MVAGHFGLTRWSLALRESKSNCWVQPKTTPPAITLNGHTTPAGYDLSAINFDHVIMLSVYQHSEAKLHLIDATTMIPQTSRPFPSLVGKGTGRVDSYTDNFYKYRATTCVINGGKLLCETINYTTGASISAKSVTDASTGLYDPALCSIGENKYYLVATKVKFYFFDADDTAATAKKDLAMVAGFDVQDMKSFYARNEIFILTTNSMFAAYFQDPTGEDAPISPFMHPHCTNPGEDGGNPTQAQFAEGLAFSRVCTTCVGVSEDQYTKYSKSLDYIPSDEGGSDGDKKFCVLKTKAGVKPSGAPREAKFDFVNIQWKEDDFEEKCGTKPAASNSTSTNNSNTTTTDPTAAASNSTSFNTPP